MIYADKVVQFCYDGLLPQLRKYNFNIILRMVVNRHEIIGRLLEINELSYTLTVELVNTQIIFVKILRISEMEIIGDAHNSDEWRTQFTKVMRHE